MDIGSIPVRASMIIYKILIARSIADRPKLLLLEDTFEHLDAEARKSIIDFLVDKSNGWTVVAASRDEYLAQKSDKIVLMKNLIVDH